ncbi:hypothetical protein AX16_009178 [Volvariella volvacea WC 439]|nr:hypothetical protein AX16_009178 [Volvariella volvacea WC 439]
MESPLDTILLSDGSAARTATNVGENYQEYESDGLASNGVPSSTVLHERASLLSGSTSHVDEPSRPTSLYESGDSQASKSVEFLLPQDSRSAAVSRSPSYTLGSDRLNSSEAGTTAIDRRASLAARRSMAHATVSRAHNRPPAAADFDDEVEGITVPDITGGSAQPKNIEPVQSHDLYRTTGPEARARLPGSGGLDANSEPGQYEDSFRPRIQYRQGDTAANGSNNMISSNIGSNNVINNSTFIYNFDEERNKFLSLVLYDAMHTGKVRADKDTLQCHKETRKAIICDIVTWIETVSREKGILWLVGPAGIGKSAVAMAIAKTLDAYNSKAKVAGSFFFFFGDPLTGRP